MALPGMAGLREPLDSVGLETVRKKDEALLIAVAAAVERSERVAGT